MTGCDNRLGIGSRTEIFGVVGYPIEHSLSPLMHNAALKHENLDAVYLPFAVEPDRLPLLIDSAKVLNIKGFNVTMPYKENIIPYLDEIDDDSRLLGSVNVVKLESGKAKGYTTDGAGFLSSLAEEGVTPRGLVLILGAGGAARAIGFALARHDCEMVFVNRTQERVISLADDISRLTGTAARALSWNEEGVRDLQGKADLIINTTSLGMYPQVDSMPPLDPTAAKPDAVICDIVYNPLETDWLKRAREHGLKTINGLGMLINQGALSWKIFWGREAPRRVMRNALELHLLKN